MSSVEPTGETPASDPSVALSHLRELRAQQELLATQLDAIALEARDLGATWAQVGEATGVSAQAAYQRWSAGGKAKHAERQRKLYSLQRDATDTPLPKGEGRQQRILEIRAKKIETLKRDLARAVDRGDVLLADYLHKQLTDMEERSGQPTSPSPVELLPRYRPLGEPQS